MRYYHIQYCNGYCGCDEEISKTEYLKHKGE